MKKPEGRKHTEFEPAYRFIILSTLTFGAYEWYWGWHAWAVARAANESKLNATLRGTFLGFTGFFLARALYKAHKQPGRALYYAAASYLGVSLVFAMAIGTLKPTGWLLLGAYLMVGLVEGLVLLPIHRALAQVWRMHPKIAGDVGLSPNVPLVFAVGVIMYLSLRTLVGSGH